MNSSPSEELSSLRKIFYSLPKTEQLLLMDLAVFYPQRPLWSKRLDFFEWLSMVNDVKRDSITSQLNKLNGKSVLEDLGDGSAITPIHDFWYEFCAVEATARPVDNSRSVQQLVYGRWLYEVYDPHFRPGDSSLSDGGWEMLQRRKMLQRICLMGGGYPFSIASDFTYCTNVSVLKLVSCHLEGQVLDLRPLQSLRSLEVLSCTLSTSESCPAEVRGLGSVRKLAVLKWDKIPRESPWIQDIGLLTELQLLELEFFENEHELPDLSSLIVLREATIRFGDGAYNISGLSLKMFETWRVAQSQRA